jgi:hypothetical protein
VSERLLETMREALRPLIEEVVHEQVEAAVASLRDHDEQFLTTTEYAARFKTTPGAVLARINRRTLYAVKPPGAREWLIPVTCPADDGG